MTVGKDTWLRRSLRRFTLGSGPLKRRSDHVEVVGRLAVVLSLLVAAPLAVAATTVTTDHLEALAAAEAAERHLVSAVLLEDARAQHPRGGDQGDRVRTTVPAQAVWSVVPGGAPHEGVVLARSGTVAGQAVPVWVDDDGSLTRPPLDPAGIPGSAMATGAVFLIGVPTGTWTLHAVLCCALGAQRARPLGAQRARRWEQGWAAVEPEWASRLL